MAKVVFSFENEETIIDCDFKDKMKDIFIKYCSKTQKDVGKLYFRYNANIIKEDMNYGQILNEVDKKRNIMNKIVSENSNSILLNEKMIKSKEIICPECKESILIEIKDYKINLSKCKNGHEIKNILFKDYEKTQYIDISKINNINNKCIKHKKDYDKYCKDCNLNICPLCSKEHKEHNTIYFDELLNNDEINMINMKELKEYIDKFNNYIKLLIEKLNNVINNMELYYNISNNIININEELNYPNYQVIKNMEQFKNYNNTIIKDIKEIIEEEGYNKFQNIIDIYDKMNNQINNKENIIIQEINENNNIIQIKKELNSIDNKDNESKEELN